MANKLNFFRGKYSDYKKLVEDGKVIATNLYFTTPDDSVLPNDAKSGSYCLFHGTELLASGTHEADLNKVISDVAALSEVVSGINTDLSSYKVKDLAAGDKIISLTDGVLSSELSLEYVSSAQTIYLKGLNGEVISEVPASDFIKDGMLQNVELETSGDTTNLVFTFNTDSDQEPVKVDVTSLLNGTELDALTKKIDDHMADDERHLTEAERTEIEALIGSYGKDELDAKFEEIEEAFSQNVSAHTELAGQVATVSNNLSNLSSTVDTLSGKVDDNYAEFTGHVASADTKFAAIDQAIADAATAATAADEALQEAIDAVSGKVDDNYAEFTGHVASADTKFAAIDKAIEDVTSAYTAADEALQEAVDAVSGKVDDNYAEFTGHVASADTKFAAIDKAIEDVTSAYTAADEALQEAVDAVSGKVDDNYAEFTGHVASADTKFAAIDKAIEDVTSAYTAADEALQQAIDDLASANTEAHEALTASLDELAAEVSENEQVTAEALTDLKANKVSSVSSADSNIVVTETKDENGINYTIDFMWLEF